MKKRPTKKQQAVKMLEEKDLKAIVHRADGVVNGEIQVEGLGYFESWDDVIESVGAL